ncbi:MAG: cation:proton antiporter [Candidimonas sp.]|nr:MAG: cation:proton antiporter [Candidimonas sp.]
MNTVPLWAAIPAALLIILSGLITLTGSLGLLRFHEFRARMHAPATGNTLGVVFLAAASILLSLTADSHPLFQEILVPILLIVTSPVTAMLLMQAADRRDAAIDDNAPDQRDAAP